MVLTICWNVRNQIPSSAQEPSPLEMHICVIAKLELSYMKTLECNFPHTDFPYTEEIYNDRMVVWRELERWWDEGTETWKSAFTDVLKYVWNWDNNSLEFNCNVFSLDCEILGITTLEQLEDELGN